MSVIPVIDPPTQKDEITKIKDLLYSQLEREMKGGSLFLLDEDGGDSLGAKKSLEELVVAGKEAVMDQMKVVVAPLRVSPLGAHIDHQLGEVTGFTINRYVYFVFLPISHPSVILSSTTFSPPLSFPLPPPPHKKQDWGNHARGASLALINYIKKETTEPSLKGMIGLIHSTMPIGGLSSSAASTLCYLFSLEHCNGVQVSREDKVELCRQAENDFLGLKNGLLDQTTILFSRPSHLTCIDCQKGVGTTPTLVRWGGDNKKDERISFGVMVVYCGKSRVLANTNYNNRVGECREAASLLLQTKEEKKLREVPVETYEMNKHKLPDNLAKRARHFMTEQARVFQGKDEWKKGNCSSFGDLVFASGDSSVHNYECGSPQLVSLYEIFSQIGQEGGVYGARFSGGGFGGCCLAVVNLDKKEEIVKVLHETYTKKHPEEASCYSMHFCESAEAVGLFNLRAN